MTNLTAPKTPKSTDEIELLTVDQIASWLNKSTSAVYRLVWRRQIPYLKFGKSVRFDRQEILKWLEGKKVEVE